MLRYGLLKDASIENRVLARRISCKGVIGGSLMHMHQKSATTTTFLVSFLREVITTER